MRLLQGNSLQAVSPNEFLNLRDVTFHTDAETVLKSINSKSAKLQVFLGNRIGKIRRETAVNQWHHIPGIHNPADCSRGIEPTDVEAVIALHRGPDFLQLDLEHWLKSERHNEEMA